MRDFFISYTKSDLAWAEWVASTLEKNGYQTYIQTWDFKPGSNFMFEMHKASSDSLRIIAIISKAYLESLFTQPEWAAALGRDPTGRQRLLLPIRVESCNLTGLLKSIVYIDLVGLNESDATTTLLHGIKGQMRIPRSKSPFNESDPKVSQFPIVEPFIQVNSLAKQKEIAEGILLLDSIPELIANKLYSYGVSVIDVDNMGGINKKFGTAIGDGVLARITSLATSYFRDAIFGRCGDDTLFVVSHFVSEQNLLRRLKKFSSLIHEYNWSGLFVDGLEVSVCCSGAQFRHGESPADTTLRAALGCREAQKQGKSCCVPAPLYLAPTVRRLFEEPHGVLSHRIRWVHS